MCTASAARCTGCIFTAWACYDVEVLSCPITFVYNWRNQVGSPNSSPGLKSQYSRHLQGYMELSQYPPGQRHASQWPQAATIARSLCIRGAATRSKTLYHRSDGSQAGTGSWRCAPPSGQGWSCRISDSLKRPFMRSGAVMDSSSAR